MGRKHRVLSIFKANYNSDNNNLKYFYIILLFVLSNFAVMATHNRAGEITYKQISAYTYEITVTTFTNRKPTNDGATPADREALDVFWGDDTYSLVPRATKVILPDYFQKNTYVAQHTFPGPGTYSIVVEDPNRNEGVENIPNSVNVVFSIKTILQINSLLGINNTPILLNPPIDKAGTYRRFVHNPAAYDPDGDSISYRLTKCTGENGQPIPNYTLPESSNTPIYIDAITGDLVWDSPMEAGIYNIAFFIEEWRKGVKIGQITRDMQIQVFDTDNTPPKIDAIDSYCVTAGDTVSFNVTARDSLDQRLVLYANGGVFEVDNSATFISDTSYGIVQGTLNWVTKCENVRKSPYQVVFKATELDDSINLVDQKNTYITVLGQAPKLMAATADNNTIMLNWESYNCNLAKGFKIYRSTNYYGLVQSECETGVPPYTGYQLIKTINEINDVQFLDNNNGEGLNQGFEYCYIMTAFYDDDLEGKASTEICAELERGTPIITQVSVTKHDQQNGEIHVEWSKPIELDTILYPGPHTYIIKRSAGIWGNDFEVIATLPSLNDTIYYDTQINTIDQPYSYQVEIHNNDGLTEQPMTASSIFLNLKGSDNNLEIEILKNTPWINSEYTIFRKNNTTNQFDSIGSTPNEMYSDSHLINNTEYCYQVKSKGAYDIDDIKKPLYNFSHQNCGIPIDTVPPKKLSLGVTTDCKTFINTLNWLPDIDETEIIKYFIYYKPEINGQLILIDSVLNPDSLEYKHILVDYPSGCYAVTAIDSNLNESILSDVACIDNCSFYELPNVFTPNNDNKNDFYIPITPASIVQQFVAKVDFSLYSRWGDLIFETNDPEIKWDGKHQRSDRKVNPGVYYYVCSVFEKRISGIEERNIVGFVHVYYNKEDK